jgi:hypothetical protein
MNESQANKYVKHFVVVMVEVFGPDYLRAPNAQDMAQILEHNTACGISGMLGSIDCRHWR